MSSIGQGSVSTSVEKGGISRPLAKVVVSSIGVRGDTIVVGRPVAVGEGSIGMSSIGQGRVSTSVEKGSISLRLSISRSLAKVVISVRGDTIVVGKGEGSISMSSVGQRRVSTRVEKGSISVSLGLSLSAGNSNQCRYNNKEFHVNFFGSSDLA